MYIDIKTKNSELFFYDFKDCGLFDSQADRPLTGDIIVSNYGVEYKVEKCVFKHQVSKYPVLEFYLEETGNVFKPTIYQQIRDFLANQKDNRFEFEIDGEPTSIRCFSYYHEKEKYLEINNKRISFVLGCTDAEAAKTQKKVLDYLKEQNIIN